MSVANNTTASGHHAYQPTLPDQIVLWHIAILATFGNATIIIAFCNNRRLRTVTNYFVVSMAVSDLLSASLLLPLYLLLGLANPAVMPLIMFILVALMCNICICTYDRYVAVAKALLYKVIMQRRRVCFLIGCAWCVAAVVSSLPTVLGRRVQQSKLFMPAFLGTVVFSMIFAMLALIGAYVHLFAIAQSHRRFSRSQHSAKPLLEEIHLKDMKQKRLRYVPSFFKSISTKKVARELRYVKLFALVGITFIVCWLPFLYMNLVADVLQRPALAPLILQEISLHTIFISSLINPIIYGYYQKDFQRAVCACFRKRDTKRFASSRNITHSTVQSTVL